MKFSYFLFVGLIIFCGSAFCWPFEEDEEPSFSPEYEGYYNFGNFQQEFPDNDYESQLEAEEGLTYFQEEPKLPSDAMKELQRQMDENSGSREYEETGVMIEDISSGRVLMSGCTLGLQLLQNNRWLSCSSRTCSSHPCPGRFMEGSDWNKCWGEVFQMYRAKGRGNVRSGDYVGLYYPREGKWFSVWKGRGTKQSCPGKPNIDIGFHQKDNWRKCGGEVFVVFAKGRKRGEAIRDQDAISLYYPCGRQMVNFGNKGVSRNSCMLNIDGVSSYCGRSPGNNAFDKCPCNVVEMTIRRVD